MTCYYKHEVDNSLLSFRELVSLTNLL